MSQASKRLREARVMAGFKTAADAARHFGWPEGTYRAHEAGRGLRLTAINEYATAFAASPQWLAFGGGDDDPAPGQALPDVVQTIRQGRRALGLTSADLAERLDPTDATVSRWEAGKQGMQAAKLSEIAGALGSNASELLGEPTEPQTEVAPGDVDPLLLMAWKQLDRHSRRQLVLFALIMAGEKR